ncbi:MAG: hypothetical protein K8T10_20420 [Candidatus Eremiobacteraeota bacterium]|nr:hypothetical protein [Candidatus Eremiobacteraeota bacterium]
MTVSSLGNRIKGRAREVYGKMKRTSPKSMSDEQNRCADSVETGRTSSCNGNEFGLIKYSALQEFYDEKAVVKFLEEMKETFEISGESIRYRDSKGAKKKADIDGLLTDLAAQNVSFGKNKLIFHNKIEGNGKIGDLDTYMKIKKQKDGNYRVSLFVNGKKEDVDKVKKELSKSELCDYDEWKDRKFSNNEFVISVLPGGPAYIEKKYTGRVSNETKISEIARIARIAGTAVALSMGIPMMGHASFAPICFVAPPLVNILAGISQTVERRSEIKGELSEKLPKCLKPAAKAMKYILHPVTSVLNDKKLMAKANVALSANGLAQSFTLYTAFPKIDILTHFLSGYASIEVGDKALGVMVKDGAKLSGIDKTQRYKKTESYLKKHEKGFELIRKTLLFSLVGIGWEVFEVATGIEKAYTLNAASDFIAGLSANILGWTAKHKIK